MSIWKTFWPDMRGRMARVTVSSSDPRKRFVNVAANLGFGSSGLSSDIQWRTLLGKSKLAMNREPGFVMEKNSRG